MSNIKEQEQKEIEATIAHFYGMIEKMKSSPNGLDHHIETEYRKELAEYLNAKGYTGLNTPHLTTQKSNVCICDIHALMNLGCKCGGV